MTNTEITLWAVIVVLVLLPPRYDPAIRLKEWLSRKPDPQPPCYGDYPFMYPVEVAERDCHNCLHAYGCHEDSPDPRGPRP